MTEAFQSWSIIIFAYNEEVGIKNIIEKAINILERISPKQKELIIVDDCSTDNTSKIIKQYAENNPEIILVQHKKNLGIGSALLSGYAIAKYENICAVPADGQFNLEELLSIACIPENFLVSFYRKKKIGYSLYRKLLSFANRRFNRDILGLKMRDVNWVKVYKKDAINSITKVLTSSLVESEICAKIFFNGYMIIEIESVCQHRQGGKSKGVSQKILLQAIAEMYALSKEIKKYKKTQKLNKKG